MKRTFAAILLVLALLMTSACSGGKDSGKASVISTVTHDEKFGSATLSLSQDEFEAAGFQLGDSCDVVFENGIALTDVPYFNGYYVRTGNPVIVAYPGADFVSVTLCNKGIWDDAELKDKMQVTVTLNSKGKYSPVQDALGQVYSFNREDYKNDMEFSNFRTLTGGSLKPGYLYRGASPVDNSRGRAPCTDALLEMFSIGFVIDLADSQEDMEGYLTSDGFASIYTEQLRKDGKVALLSMGSDYQSDEYKQQLASGIRQMLEAEDCPVYIHCMEGKDRTGFVCMLLEALAGASYDEMLDDYMITYKNYYSISKKGSEKYDAVRDLYFNSFMEFLHGTSETEELRRADYSRDAADYLKAGGLSDAEIQALTDRITVK